MAPPLKGGPFVESRAPDGYTYDLTGPRWGWASFDAHHTELTVNSRSSKNAWDSHVRVRITAPGGRLTCDPARSGPLVDDAGSAWGTLIVEAERVAVADRDGVTRVEVMPLKGKPRDGSAVLGGVFEVRVLDADGFAATPKPTFTP